MKLITMIACLMAWSLFVSLGLGQTSSGTQNSTIMCGVEYDGKFIHIDPATGQKQIVRSDLPSEMQALALAPDGTLYGANSRNIYTIQPITGAYEFVRSPTLEAFETIRGMTFMPSGQLYISTEVTSSSIYPRLRTVDLVNGSSSLLGSLSPDGAQGLEISPSGVLYANAPFYKLYTIDPGTMQKTIIIKSVTWELGQSLTFAPDGSLYVSGCQAIAKVNPATGELIGSPVSISGDIRGIEIVSTSFSVSGTVTLDDSDQHSGVTMTFTSEEGSGSVPAAVQTDASGAWSQSGFELGTKYRVTASKIGYNFFSPSHHLFSSANTALNFTGYVPVELSEFHVD